ncbi:Atu4866 domain-containing protein [Streptomyces sp. B5E4]|uniref:Atu4866 domain-containing protein n=1 Tax=Streptomyces sp. B5E4 TaxID=3153568 RepID=UPI00325D6C14
MEARTRGNVAGMKANYARLPVALLGMVLALTACSSSDTAPTSTTSSSVDKLSSSSADPSSSADTPMSSQAPKESSGAEAVTGVWATDDGQLRRGLRADGTFVEDFNGQKAAYEGSYTVEGSMLCLNTTSGITVEGTIGDDRIEIDGYDLRRAS